MFVCDVTACCNASAGAATLELYDQGCYSESLSDREFSHRVNLTGLADLVPSVCVEQCRVAGFPYAAVQVRDTL